MEQGSYQPPTTDKFIFLIWLVVGFIIFYALTNPKSSIHKKLPQLKIKRIQFLPSVKILISGKIFHLHHWLGFSILLVISIFIEGGFLGYLATKGFLSGGAIQGLFNPNSFKLIYDNTD